jgi:hypothetical protein
VSDRLPAPQRDDVPGAVDHASATPAQRVAPAPHEHRGRTGAAPPRSLRELQLWLRGAITENTDDDVDAVITPGPRLAAADRLLVYQAGYFARLVECLTDDYPATAAAVGTERFAALCHAYVARHPSASPNLNAFGRHMPTFCREASVLEPDERAFYADLASIEWALVEVIHAAFAHALDATRLQGIPMEAFETAQLLPSAAVRLLTLAHPANAFLQAYRASGKVPAIPPPGPTAVVVYRSGPTVWRMDLTPAMARVLGALLDGATIGQALATMETDTSDAAALAEAERSVMVWFREWIEGGLFSDLRLAPP